VLMCQPFPSLTPQHTHTHTRKGEGANQDALSLSLSLVRAGELKRMGSVYLVLVSALLLITLAVHAHYQFVLPGYLLCVFLVPCTVTHTHTHTHTQFSPSWCPPFVSMLF
jgi:hypothetical protein